MTPAAPGSLQPTAPDSSPLLPPPGEHGDDARRVASALGIEPGQLLDLATTLNPVAPDVAAFVTRSARAVRWYPDASLATEALAKRLRVDTDRVVLTNGGAEAIALVAAEYPSGSVDVPEFGLYRRHLAEIIPGAPRWKSNPSSPFGQLADSSETAFVWDEAHYPLATGKWTRRDLGAIVVGSLTKLLACPGLRIGYIVAPDVGLAERLRARQPQWSVNGLACDALPDLLDEVDLATWQREISTLRTDLVSLLESHGFAPLASDAPWLLVPDTNGLRDRLAPQGVLVRDCTSFGLPSHTRIGVPNQAGLDRLDSALNATGGHDGR